MADIVSSFMHEINNPLSNIYMLVQAMESENDIDSIKQYSSLIQQSIQQVKNLQIDYNEYRKTGKTSIKPSMINVSTLLSSLVEEYRILASKKNVHIMLSIKPCRVFTDGVKLKQVLSNILSNAIKYNVNKGSITVSCVGAGRGADITISDTGIGMDPTELKQLGMPFYRCKRIEADGTGLGFSLIKKIAESLGWGLSITSEVKVGTSITLAVR